MENKTVTVLMGAHGGWGVVKWSGSPRVVVLVGLPDFHPHWCGLERGSDPSTPLLTTAQLWG